MGQPRRLLKQSTQVPHPEARTFLEQT